MYVWSVSVEKAPESFGDGRDGAKELEYQIVRRPFSYPEVKEVHWGLDPGSQEGLWRWQESGVALPTSSLNSRLF